MGTGSAVTVTREGAATVVTLCRPEVRNAVDRATAEALYDAFVAFDADPTSSVAVLTGAGGTFCSGADLAAIAAGEPNEVTVPASVLGSRGPMGPTRLVLGKPVIAAVEGYAVAGGLELALWADLRVVAEDAVPRGSPAGPGRRPGRGRITGSHGGRLAAFPDGVPE